MDYTDGSEAEHLSDILEGQEYDEISFYNSNHIFYKTNKQAKVGTSCKCPQCGSSFVKMHYQQAFCKPIKKINGKKVYACKDKYWNSQIGRINRTIQYME